MPGAYETDLAQKLNLWSCSRMRVLGKPAEVDLADLPTDDSPQAEGVLLFARTLEEVDAQSGPVLDAAREDRIAWLAYPKAKKLGTDLNRDILWRHLLPRGVRPVRQVSLDDVWSAMRFRPGSPAAAGESAAE
jgi:hypothetical protein